MKLIKTTTAMLFAAAIAATGAFAGTGADGVIDGPDPITGPPWQAARANAAMSASRAENGLRSL